MSECSFPLTMPATVGGCGYVPDEPTLDGTALAYQADHCADGKTLLLWQFQGKPRLETMLCAFIRAAIQPTEDLYWQLLTETWLDTGVGKQLDRIGWLVDMPRKGWTDAVYRQILRAQIRVLRSEGTWPDLVRVMDLVGVDVSLAEIEDLSVATGRVRLGEPFSGLDITEPVLFDLLNRARTGGTRFDLQWPSVDTADAFTLAEGDAITTDSAKGCADDSPITSGGKLDGIESTEDS